MLDDSMKTLSEGTWEVRELEGSLSAIRAVWERLKGIIVVEYLDDLVDMYESFAESEGLPVWSELTATQQEAAISAVVFLHENVDEYHAMVDAIERTA